MMAFCGRAQFRSSSTAGEDTDVVDVGSLVAGMKLCSAGRQVQRRNGLHGNRVPVAHVVYALHGLFKRTLYVQVDDGWSHKISWASYQCDGVETTVRIVRLDRGISQQLLPSHSM